jgi:Zn-dependent protease
VSDPSAWWPGGREGAAPGPSGQSGPAGPSSPPGGGAPYSGGTYYYPPGTTPGADRATNGAPRPPRPGVSPQHWLWVAIGVAVGIVLVRVDHINRVDVILFCVLIPSIILHEVAHGWVALAFGDDTAKRAGRLTLNPIPHIDIVGTIIIPIILIASGFGFFGWAKPVPVNVAKLRSPRNQGVLVSLAGPATNLVICALSAVVFHLFGGVKAANVSDPALWVWILYYIGVVNLWLAIFNMIPIPPLDGSVLIERMLPGAWWPRYLEVRRYTLPVVLIVVLLASYIHYGDTTLVGHLSDSMQNWWDQVLGIGG